MQLTPRFKELNSYGTEFCFLEAINNHENQEKIKNQASNIKQNINNSQVLKEQNIEEKGKDVKYRSRNLALLKSTFRLDSKELFSNI